MLSLIQLLGCNDKFTKKVRIDNACVLVEIADSSEKRQQGLMFRKSLVDNQGMFFIFGEEARHAFWMKNMYFPLDIIWINHDKRIVDIYENALPCKDVCKIMVPHADAKFVLEVNSGFVEKNQIKIGDRIGF